MIKYIREILPVCPVCNKKVMGRKLLLVTKELSTGKQEVNLCERCFFRIPDGLHRQLISNAQSFIGEEFNTMVIKALRNTPDISDLNRGVVVLLNGDKFKFKFKFKKCKSLNESHTECIIHTFDNGKIISKTS